MRLRSSALVFAILAAAASAQTQLADLLPNAATGFGGSSSEFAVLANGSLAVFRGDGAFGSEPYVTDGTPAGTRLLVDLAANGDSSPREMVVLGNEVLFRATVPGLGIELWKTDGTPAGTKLVRDIAPGNSNSFPLGLCVLGNHVYFSALDSNGRALWRSDGTAAGTVLVVDVNPTAAGFLIQDLTVVGSRLFFVTNDGTHGDELFVTDGTAAGTSLVVDLTPGSAGSDIDDLAAFGNQLVFAADQGDGMEPWISDGTAAGTMQLADLRSGAAGSDPHGFVTVGGKCVFVAASDVFGEELFVTDGTPAGTVLLADIEPGAADSDPRELTSFGNFAVFQANGPDGSEPYRTNGTTAGTYQIADLAPLGSSFPSGFVQVGAEVWFSARDPIAGYELFSTDGSAAGTVLLGNLLPGPDGIDASDLIPFGSGVLCFSLIDGSGSPDPTFSDGTVGGTFQLADISRTATDSEPSGWAELADGRVVFVADGDLVGRELFVTDGSAAGTQLLADLVTGPTASQPEWLTPRGGDLFCSAELAGSRQLFAVDTQTGAFAQCTNGGSDYEPRHLVQNGSRVLFSASGANGRELWRSDGTAGGTGLVFDVMPGPGDGIDEDAGLVTLGGLTLFAADDGVHGVELWASDGSSNGTYMVVDLEPGSASADPSGLTIFDGMLYFAASSPTHGYELWRTDGTAAGTTLAADVRAGASSSYPGNLIVADDRLFFTANTATSANAIYAFDGAAVVYLRDLSLNLFGERELAAAAGGVFFIDSDFIGSGLELWFSDGSVAGTAMVADIGPGAVDGPVAGSLTPMLGGGQLLFAASDLQAGLQLWRSDGTAANTRPISSFGGDRVGAAHISDLFASGTFSVFAGNDGIDGIEPWVLDAVQQPLPFVLPYGVGCAAAGQPVPTTGGIGLPTVGNGAFAITVQDVPAATIAVPTAAGAAAELPLGNGCTVWILPPPILLAPTLTNGAGRAMTPVPVPNDPLLVGSSLFFQWAVYTPGGPFLGDFSLSDGVHMQVGG